MKNGLLSHFFIITNTVCKSGFFKKIKNIAEAMFFVLYQSPAGTTVPSPYT